MHLKHTFIDSLFRFVEYHIRVVHVEMKSDYMQNNYLTLNFETTNR